MDSIDLSGFVKTKAQARELSVRLSAITDQVFKTDFQLDRALSEQFGIQKKELFLSLLRNQNVNSEKASDLKEFLMKLQELLNSLPVLSISLAIEPTEKTVKVLSDWFLMHLKRQVLLDITVDPSLIAGIAIHYNGRFLDYTIRDKVNAVITTMLTVPQAHTAVTQ